jgi:hypothetical protein
MSITNALASIAVKDLSTSLKWYRALFGRSADSTPAPQVAEWRFQHGGSLQVYELEERAGGSSATLCVSSVTDQIANLRKLGIDPGSMASANQKVVMIKDPDGNSIAFVERPAAP